MIAFDTIVVGKGLVGSAAAKYLSIADKNVAVIGPDEPENYNDAMVFASHYDQSRVQRLIGKDEVWTRLNLESAAQYANLQQQTGINFHKAVGCLYVNPYGEDDYLKNAASLSSQFNLPFNGCMNAQAIKKTCRDFNFPETAKGLLEPAPAGWINPRLLIQAQLKIFQQQQGTVIRETVISIAHTGDRFYLKTNEGNTYHSKKVVLAAGSFVNFLNLLPKKLGLKIKSEVVLLAKVSEADALSMSQLPSLLYEINDGETEGIYLIQPVQYPDGNYYIKMGCNMPDDIFFDDIENVQEWFRKANSEQLTERLLQALKNILPHVTISGCTTKKCIISRTVHGRPYIGETGQSGLYVAGGCNGYSAMCSDSIGSIAAELLQHGVFPKNYSKHAFTLLYENEN